MTVPGFQEFMLPALKALAHGNEISIRDARIAVEETMRLPEADRSELIAGGTQTKSKNRAHWAIVYLKQAGLIEGTRRGYYRITAEGKRVLKESPVRVDVKFLGRYPKFAEFMARSTSRKKQSDGEEREAATVAEVDPLELLEETYSRLFHALSSQLVDAIKAAPPAFFEKLVVDLMLRLGYGGTHEDAGRVIGRSGDGGVDGVIKEDRLGLDNIYLQAKRWEGVVGEPTVRDFVGALVGHQTRKGVIITTSSFTKGAREYAARVEYKIALIDGEELARLMIAHDLGVSKDQEFVVKKIDNDYFGDD